MAPPRSRTTCSRPIAAAKPARCTAAAPGAGNGSPIAADRLKLVVNDLTGTEEVRIVAASSEQATVYGSIAAAAVAPAIAQVDWVATLNAAAVGNTRGLTPPANASANLTVAGIGERASVADTRADRRVRFGAPRHEGDIRPERRGDAGVVRRGGLQGAEGAFGALMSFVFNCGIGNCAKRGVSRI